MAITTPRHAVTDRRAGRLLTLAVAAWLTVVGLAANWKYVNLRYTAMDLGILTQVVSRSAAGDWFGSTIHPPTYLGDHFSPAVLALTLPYRLLPSPLTLIALLQVALALGAWPVYRLARVWMGPNAALAAGIAYLISPFTQNLALFEFHFIAFAVPVLLAAAHAYARRHLGPFLVWCTLGLLVREDVALVVGGFALLAVLERRPWRWVLVPGVAAAVWLPAALAVIRAAGESGNYKFVLYYAWLGATPRAMLQTVVLQPWRWISMLLRPANLVTAAGLLLPFAFLPLRVQAALVLVAGPALQMFLGAPGGGDLVLRTQYSALFLPGLWWGFCAALGRTRPAPISRPGWLKRLAADRQLAVIILATAAIYGSLTLGPLPGTAAAVVRAGWRTPESRLLAALMEQIPPAASVAASYAVLPALASRPHVASLNYAFIGRQQLSRLPYQLPADTDFALLDIREFLTYQLQYQRHFLYASDYPSAAARLRERLAELHLFPTAVAGPWVLFARQAAPRFTLYDVFDQPPPNLNGESRKLENGLEFLGWRRLPPAPGPLPAEAQVLLALYWRTTRPLTEPLNVELHIAGKPISPLLPLGNGLFPVTDWPLQKVVVTNYWLTEPVLNTNQLIELQLVTVQDGGLYLTPDLGTEARVTASTMIGFPIRLETTRALQSRP